MKKRIAMFSVVTVIIVSVLFLFPVQISAQPTEGPPIGNPGEGFVHLSVDPGVAGEETKFTLKFDEPFIIDSIELDYYFVIVKYHGSWDGLMNEPNPEDFIIYDKMGTAHPPDKIKISRDLSEGQYFGFLEALPFVDNFATAQALDDGMEFSNWDKVKFNVEEVKEEEEKEEIIVEPVWIRTMPMTCYQVWVNSDNMFEMVFWYPYADNNWVKIYDMSGKLVYEVNMLLYNPHIIVDLPNGMYTVKTFNDQPEPIQTFVIGK